MDSLPTAPAPRQHAALAFIFVTVMLDMLAFGIIIPVLPQLIVQLIGGSIARAAVWAGAFGTVYMLMQFVFSPVQGALSDRYGRRRVILISSLGLGVDFIVMALAPALWLLFVGRAISGACSASFSTANAYIADITPKESARPPSARWARLSASASSWDRRWAACSAIGTCACRSGWPRRCRW
jgi:Arabinose efflux permease